LLNMFVEVYTQVISFINWRNGHLFDPSFSKRKSLYYFYKFYYTICDSLSNGAKMELETGEVIIVKTI